MKLHEEFKRYENMWEANEEFKLNEDSSAEAATPLLWKNQEGIEIDLNDPVAIQQELDTHRQRYINWLKKQFQKEPPKQTMRNGIVVSKKFSTLQWIIHQAKRNNRTFKDELQAVIDQEVKRYKAELDKIKVEVANGNTTVRALRFRESNGVQSNGVKNMQEATEIPSDDYYIITTTEGGKRYYIRNDIDFKNPPEDAYEWFTHDLDKAQLFSSRKMAGEYFAERKLADNVFALGPNNRRVRYYDYVKTPYECWLIDTGALKESSGVQPNEVKTIENKNAYERDWKARTKSFLDNDLFVDFKEPDAANEDSRVPDVAYVVKFDDGPNYKDVYLTFSDEVDDYISVDYIDEVGEWDYHTSVKDALDRALDFGWTDTNLRIVKVNNFKDAYLNGADPDEELVQVVT